MSQNSKKNMFLPIGIISLCIFAFFSIVWQNFVKADFVFNKNNDDKSISEIIQWTAQEIISTNIIQAQKKYQNEFDTESDYSFQKYVSDNNILQNKEYEPSDLVQVTWKHIIIATKKPYLRQAAATAFQDLSEQFHADFWKDLYLASAYRSYKDQERLREVWCSTLKCAKIWWSEHQLWLAVDIHIANPKWWYTQFSSGYLDWMNENAYKYWFINTYSKWPKVDGKMAEIWHRRFVWIPFAIELHEKDMSFAERINNLKYDK